MLEYVNRVNRTSDNGQYKFSDYEVADILTPIIVHHHEEGVSRLAVPVIRGFKMCSNATFHPNGVINNCYSHEEIHEGGSMYSYNEDTNTLVIVHPVTRPPAYSDRDAIDNRINYTTKCRIDALNNEGKKVTKIIHIIPEVGRGNIQYYTGGLFGGDHIRLRIAEGDPIDIPHSYLIDPRAVAQGSFDDLNCGRYVTAMTAQAARLAISDRPITNETLKQSQTVLNAAQYGSIESLRKSISDEDENVPQVIIETPTTDFSLACV